MKILGSGLMRYTNPRAGGHVNLHALGRPLRESGLRETNGINVLGFWDRGVFNPDGGGGTGHIRVGCAAVAGGQNDRRRSLPQPL